MAMTQEGILVSLPLDDRKARSHDTALCLTYIYLVVSRMNGIFTDEMIELNLLTFSSFFFFCHQHFAFAHKHHAQANGNAKANEQGGGRKRKKMKSVWRKIIFLFRLITLRLSNDVDYHIIDVSESLSHPTPVMLAHLR
jgi:hypothetical protein